MQKGTTTTTRRIYFLSFSRMTMTADYPADLLEAADASRSLGKCLCLPLHPWVPVSLPLASKGFFSFGSAADRPFIYELRPCLAAAATVGWSCSHPHIHTHTPVDCARSCQRLVFEFHFAFAAPFFFFLRVRAHLPEPPVPSPKCPAIGFLCFPNITAFVMFVNFINFIPTIHARVSQCTKISTCSVSPTKLHLFYYMYSVYLHPCSAQTPRTTASNARIEITPDISPRSSVHRPLPLSCITTRQPLKYSGS